MFMQILNEVKLGEHEKGFKVMLFDNRKGGKDHSIKLSRDINLVFSRLVRGAGFVTSDKGWSPQGNPDQVYANYFDTPHQICGFKIEDLKFDIAKGDDGKRGCVTAIIRPFGPKYVELRDKLRKQDEMDFVLCQITNSQGEVHQVVRVSHQPKVETMML